MKQKSMRLIACILCTVLCGFLTSCTTTNTSVEEEERIISDDDFIGFWHGSPYVAAAFGDRFQIYSDNSFIFHYSEYDSEKRVLSISGNWEIKENLLYLVITHKRVIEGGEFVYVGEDYSVCENKLVNGEEKTIELQPPQETIYPLKDFAESSYTEPDSLTIGGIKYWKLSPYPDGYSTLPKSVS